MGEKAQNWVQRYPGIVSGACLLGYPWLKGALQSAPKKPTGAYFYDMKTSELVVLPVDTLAPAARESGEASCVWTYVMSCTDCTKAESRFTGYLLKYTPEFHQAVGKVPEVMKSRYRRPVPVVLGLMFPEPLKSAGGKGKMIDRGQMMQIADGPGAGGGGGKMVWRAFMPSEVTSETDRLKGMCDGAMPKACEPE